MNDLPIEIVPVDADMAEIIEDANRLEKTIREQNRLPELFPRETVLEQCEAARLAARSPEEKRPELLRLLQEMFAILVSTIPRTRDPETGELEFERLRNDFNALSNVIANKAGKARNAPNLPSPDDPRNDPNAATVPDIVQGGNDVIQSAQVARTHVNGEGNIHIAGDVKNAVIINGHINFVEAMARAGKGLVSLAESAVSSLLRLAGLLTDWPNHTRKALRAADFSLALKADVLRVLGLESLAKKSDALATVMKDHANRLTQEFGAKDTGGTQAEDKATLADSYFHSVVICMQQRKTEEAHRFADLLVPIQQFLSKGNGSHVDLSSPRYARKSCTLRPLISLNAVRSLNLAGNGIYDLETLALLSSLQRLDLTATNFSDLRLLFPLKSLQSLSLKSTRVSNFSGLSKLKSLRSLNLEYTQIMNLEGLSKLETLQTLRLRSTRVSEVNTLSTLTNLQSLDLRGTQVTDVSGLSDLPNLERLYLPDGVEDNRRP